MIQKCVKWIVFFLDVVIEGIVESGGGLGV